MEHNLMIELYNASRALTLTAPVDDDFPDVMHRFHRAVDQVSLENDIAPADATVSGLCQVQYDWVESVGWHNKTVLEALALIASEVGEAVNECRGDKPTTKFGEELADICLRTFDLAQWQGVDLEQAIFDKIIKNTERGTRGRRV